MQRPKSLHRSSQAKRKQLRREPRPKLKNRTWDSYILLLKKELRAIAQFHSANLEAKLSEMYWKYR